MRLPRLDWPQTALVLGLGAIAVLALIYAPAEYHAPIGAALTLAVGVLRSIVASSPPPPPSDPGDADGPPTRPQRRPTIPPGATMALALSLALATHGCGASALRIHSTAASIASATIGDLDVRVAGACGVALSSCRGEAACREETAERCRVAAHAAEGLVASVRAYHDGITAATYADEGEVLPALAAAWRGIRDAWPAIRAALTAIGLDVSWAPEAL